MELLPSQCTLEKSLIAQPVTRRPRRRTAELKVKSSHLCPLNRSLDTDWLSHVEVAACSQWGGGSYGDAADRLRSRLPSGMFAGRGEGHSS